MTQEESHQGPELESSHEFAHVDDGFQRLWTPHRMAYINGERPTEHAGEGCPFCSVTDKSDAEGDFDDELIAALKISEEQADVLAGDVYAALEGEDD